MPILKFLAASHELTNRNKKIRNFFTLCNTLTLGGEQAAARARNIYIYIYIYMTQRVCNIC